MGISRINSKDKELSKKMDNEFEKAMKKADEEWANMTPEERNKLKKTAKRFGEKCKSQIVPPEER